MCKIALNQPQPSFTPIYLPLAALLLALGWLLPNHYHPWVSFHSEAWAAAILASIAGAALIFGKQAVNWHWLSVIVASTTPLPLLQYSFGLLPFLGDASTSSLFLLGLLIALLCGDLWQRWKPDQLPELLFLAIGTAATISVGLQLYQWLGFASDPMATPNWVHVQIGQRPYANLAQPNQLATLIIWGLLAGAWGVLKGHIGISSAAFLSAYLVFGLALTGSRTGALELMLLLAGAWYWRRKWPSQAVPWLVSLLVLLFSAAFFSIEAISVALGLEQLPSISSRADGGVGVRPALWWMLLDAAMNRPLLGYGWTQILPAQVTTLLDHPAVHGTAFGHSHNLFIDLIIWTGIPLGGLLSLVVLAWICKTFTRISNPKDVILLLIVLTVGLHAMLELPLHYAYFLFPTGLIMGILNARIHRTALFTTNRTLPLTLWTLGCIAFFLVVADYLRVEASTFALRLEKAQIKALSAAEPPETMLLTQLQANIQLARYEVRPDMTDEELVWMRNVATAFPTVLNLNKLATALAVNSHTEEATLWLRRSCPLLSPDLCEAARRRWADSQKAFPQAAMLPWPEN